jgi:hypothetical protein
MLRDPGRRAHELDENQAPSLQEARPPTDRGAVLPDRPFAIG